MGVDALDKGGLACTRHADGDDDNRFLFGVCHGGVGLVSQCLS